MSVSIQTRLLSGSSRQADRDHVSKVSIQTRLLSGSKELLGDLHGFSFYTDPPIKRVL